MGWFAMLTMILSAVGLYGVISYSVTSRRREWAVRLALGSAPAEVARIVLMRGFVLAAIGVSAGVALTLLAIRAFGAEYSAIASNASVTIFAAVAAAMLAIALGASWVPAVRVARIAPAAALRSE